ncbi:MAG: hypothetical protein P8Y99_11675 [Calditrichaceae bacterium]
MTGLTFSALFVVDCCLTDDFDFGLAVDVFFAVVLVFFDFEAVFLLIYFNMDFI